MPLKLLVASLFATSAFAAGLDRDSLLCEAPAAPDRGTVRVSGGGNASWVGSTTGGVSGAVLWAPLEHLAGDVSAYWQDGEAGPAVRLRYQLLAQAEAGVDLAVGARYKSVGFDPRNGELEGLVAVGRRFGPLDAILNLVGGAELGGPGVDLELKALLGYRLLEGLRLGLDARAQAEVHDETGFKRPDFAADVAVVGGAALAWRPLPALELQLLAGATKPKGLAGWGPTARLTASFDFQ